MSKVQYKLVKNNLTATNSYYPRVEAREILSHQRTAELINKKNPGIPTETVKTILEALREVTVEQICNGNSLTLKNFISFKPTLAGKVERVTDPLPKNSFKMKVTMSSALKKEVKSLASFQKLGMSSKNPTIVSAQDTNYGITNLVRDGFSFQINGFDIKWNQKIADEGAFMISTNQTIRQTNIAYTKGRRAFFTPVLDPTLLSPNVEYTLQVRTRCSPNGQLKTGTLGDRLRTVNVISDETTDEVFAVGSLQGPATLSYSGDEVLAKIELSMNPSGVLSAQISEIEADPGLKVAIRGDGAVTLVGLDSDVVMTVTDFDQLRGTCVAYGRYMQETINLSPLTS